MTDDPPYEKKGKGIPTTGKIPNIIAILMKNSRNRKLVKPIAVNFLNRSFDSRAIENPT